MEITSVKIHLFQDDKLMAFATVVLGKCLSIHNIRLIKSAENNLLVCMPNRRDKAGEFRDIVHPTTPEFRQNLNNAIISAYQSEIEKMKKVLASSKNFTLAQTTQPA